MFAALKRLRARSADPVVERAVFVPTLPEGERVYAIGDIHGRLDSFDRLLQLIDADDAARGPSRTTLILLGDLIDRGPDSARVVERARGLTATRDRVHAIKGNHEEVLMSALEGDDRALNLFLRIGGIETLDSYGVPLHDLPKGEEYWTLAARMREVIPQVHVDYLEGMEDHVAIGDYRFVHAGIRPGVALDAQDPTEQRWIRDLFLDHDGDHGVMVVHGHSISTDPVLKHNRLGIDTGAYSTGVLTALGLEGGERWLLQTEPDPKATDAREETAKE